MALRFLTSGESHGKALMAIIDGVPAGFFIDKEFIDSELKRRQMGYGRGGRMKIESDSAEIVSGVRLGKSMGSPISLIINNKDWENWSIPMSPYCVDESDENIQKIKEKEITKLRPGHADFAGSIKYNQNDVRNILERSSARETAARVAVGAIAKSVLKEFGVFGYSFVTQIGSVKLNYLSKNIDVVSIDGSEVRCPDESVSELMKQEIDRAQENGDTLGGSIEVVFKNIPVGLGSHVQWDRKLDGKIAQAVMSIPAVKSVEIGLGSDVAGISGSQMHDEIFYGENGFYRTTNNAGGLEGGMTNGEDIIVRLAMKAIPTMKKPLQSVSLDTHEPYSAHFERSDTCAVPACGIVAESMIAIVLADAFMESFGADNLQQIKNNYQSYLKMLKSR